MHIIKLYLTDACPYLRYICPTECDCSLPHLYAFVKEARATLTLIENIDLLLCYLWLSYVALEI